MTSTDTTIRPKALNTMSANVVDIHGNIVQHLVVTILDWDEDDDWRN
jgi:hypothetical protein